MLILKENFLKLKLLGLVLLVLFACCTAPPRVTAAAPAAPATPAPDVVAAAFYGWYLDALSADQDPLSDRYERFNTYVARGLVEQLALRMAATRATAAPGDYFLKTPHYQGAWLHTRVRALTVGRQARHAEVIVTLGEGTDAKQVLGLAMMLEGGAWKIREVKRAAPESSAGPPGI